ncbi:unnamed protein product [Blepharisma stoltei]|uniref:SKP1-like protein n=1 Tax=Blepharisma stoltei TaxID=1481888 RepID=A0AAU9JTE9_9CILI|nr:unnamed protein product [Blepharisma stoltei]
MLSSQQITLITKEGHRIVTRSELKNISVLIKNELLSQNSNEVTLSDISLDSLQKVLEFAHHHKYKHPDVPKKPLPSSNISDALEDPWDCFFIKSLDLKLLIETMSAADIMGIESLSEICQAQLATFFKNKGIEELNQEFFVDEELTLSDEEELVKKYRIPEA